jgi:hypothetical protein
MRTAARNLAAVWGLALLALNLAGLAIPLRNDAIYTEVGTAFGPGDITLTAAELRAALVRAPAEPTERYVRRATGAVNHGVAHYWREEGAARYRLHLPIWENWLLWAAGYWQPGAFGLYEICDVERAIERGVGLCSEHAIILASAFERAGVRAQILGSPRHVLTTVEVAPGVWWLADADYGVVMPFDLATARSQPELIRSAYAVANSDARTAALLRAILSTDAFDTRASARAYCGARLTIERWAYALKWLIPALLLFLACSRARSWAVLARSPRQAHRQPPGR